MRGGGRLVVGLMLFTKAAWNSIVFILSRCVWAPFCELDGLLAKLLAHATFNWSIKWLSVIASTAKVVVCAGGCDGWGFMRKQKWMLSAHLLAMMILSGWAAMSHLIWPFVILTA
eukprot:7212038-Ditylum_brightwellii.AAC.1